MAKVAKRRDRYVIDFYDHQGKRRWQTMPEGTTLKAAKDKLREIEQAVGRQVYIPPKDALSFKSIAQDWVIAKRANVRSSTLQQYDGHVRNHFAGLDTVSIDRITVKMIERWVAKRREDGVSLPLMRKVLKTLSQVLKYAVRHRHIAYNPLPDIERPRGQGVPKEDLFQVLNRDEITRLVDAADQPMYKTLFFLAAMSGARQGELLGLKWSDVLWDTNQIQIRRTFNHSQFFEPKTLGSKRKIDLGPKVMGALKRWRLACPPNDLDLVFPSEKGIPIQHSAMLRAHFHPAVVRAGLPRLRFHFLRHTCASLMIEQGEDLVYIQKQLGHAKLTETLNTYAHLIHKYRPEAAEKLELGIVVAEW